MSIVHRGTVETSASDWRFLLVGIFQIPNTKSRLAQSRGSAMRRGEEARRNFLSSTKKTRNLCGYRAPSTSPHHMPHWQRAPPAGPAPTLPPPEFARSAVPNQAARSVKATPQHRGEVLTANDSKKTLFASQIRVFSAA